MENINFRGVPTSLFLNGPKVGIVTDPQSVSNVIGVATFTGIATASFPDTNFALDGGSIAFNWYFDGSLISDDEGTQNYTSNCAIVGFSSATGTGSTITINGLTTDDDGKEVYFEAEYVPSAYSQPTGSAVTAGTARSTGNAFNEPLKSGIGTITVFPIINITTQPTGQLVSVEDTATYTIAAQKTPGGGAVNYQWQLNGNDLSDGTTTRTVIDGGDAKIAITSDAGDDTEIDFSQVSSYDSFVTGRTYTLTADANVTTKLFATGAGGGRSNVRSVSGGNGGSAEGTFTFVKDQEYKLRIGGAGVNAGAGGFSGGGNGGRGGGQGGGGGGLTGLFEGSITVGNAVIIAAGGGGGSNDPATGGAGGGLTGNAGSNGGRAGKGGTQSAGGAGANQGQPGSALQGGPGAAGGGGGYYGGGGGQEVSGCCADGAGGGGSSYIGGVTDGSTTTGTGGAANGGNGSFRIEFTAASKEVSTTVTGSDTDTLTITAEAAANGTIRCKCTATDVQESPVFSNTVSYVVVPPRPLLEIETYNYNDATATLSEFDLSNGDLTIDYASYTGNAVCLYSGDQDIDVEMEMYGGKGLGNNLNSTYPGGEGGYSRIRFTMARDEEYILTGLFSSVNAPFLYRKATLIATVGQGGEAGKRGRGGFGGGIDIAGEDAPGERGGGGSGGAKIPTGTLTEPGIFGSDTRLTSVTPDTNATGTDGGRTIPCARGVYWRDQGKSPCEDLGTIKFRTPNGTEISNTAEIARGYKSGYNIIQTKGERAEGSLSNVHSGKGGTGATGGDGGDTNYGGAVDLVTLMVL